MQPRLNQIKKICLSCLVGRCWCKLDLMYKMYKMGKQKCFGIKGRLNSIENFIYKSYSIV